MTRDYSLDILRIVAIFAVVLIHITAPYGLNNDFIVDEFDSWLVRIVNFSLFWCVPVLFMLSGALLLDKRKESMRIFYNKRLQKILLPTIFWSIIFLSYLYIYRDFTTFNVVGALLKGKPFYHLWYMFAIIGLYIFVPYIRILLTNLNNLQLRWLIVLLFVFSIGHNFSSHYLNNQSTIFSSFLTYLGYFFLGHELYKYKSKISRYRHISLSIFIISVLITSISQLVLTFIYQTNIPLISYYSPFIAAQAIALYMYVIGNDRVFTISYSNKLIYLSTLSFGVYLIHPLFIIFLEPYMTMERLYMFPLFYLLVLVGSYVTIYLMSRFKYVNKLV